MGGSSRRDLKAFLKRVRSDIGQALYTAQMGETDPAAKPLKGFGGASVMEIIDRHDTNTYRAVYTVQFADVIYVLHAFQKKSKRHCHTAKRTRSHSPQACGSSAASSAKEQLIMPIKKKNRITFEKSSGNVFADIGFANPEREQLKAHLTLQIYRIIKDRHLTQAQAGAILGIKQPHVSALMRNRSGNFSVERLMDFLIALGHDVEITVRPTRKHHGQVSVVLP
jgi:phage-related protein/predicted XRE-type DNA-binding protein